MEIIEINSNETQAIKPNNKAVTKAQTRLQARAPASLELGQITIYAAAAVADQLVTPMAIPLLSPLVLSPEMTTEKAEIDHEEKDNNVVTTTMIKIDDNEHGAIGSPKSPWQYSEGSSFDEPCYVFSFFHSQCVINPAQ